MRATKQPRLEVRILGTSEVLRPARDVLPVRQPMARALAVRLALARGQAVADDILIRDLWGKENPAGPTARLRVLASRLRAALGDHAAALERTPAGFSLRAEPTDLMAAEKVLATADAVRRTGDQARLFAATTAAIELWRGDPLSDLDGIPFVAAERRRLQSLRLELQLAWAEAGLTLGHPVGPELERLVAAHPLHERLVGLSAISLSRSGHEADALDRLRDLRTTLATELGIDPTPETVAIEDDLRGHRPELPRISLPTASKNFVGRRDERIALLAEIRRPGLITLLGGPGVGKTRLAREVAAEAARGRTVAWLDLAPLHGTDNLTAALAAAVGADRGDNSISQSAELLTGALLVVDNAEHLTADLAALLDSLRFKAVDLSILVTSQRLLGRSDESVRRIEPLPQAAAVELFCDRTGAEPSPAVEQICAAVDRLPLGIELAAGLTRTISVQQVAEQFDDRLRLIGAEGRDLNLRAALDWSHELLDPPVRAALRRLSVFAGGCTLEAAEQVVAGDGIQADEVAELLAVLVDRSLVTMDDDERFSFLETVREYGLERLRAAGEESAVRGRHAAWCVTLADFGKHAARMNRRLALRQFEAARRLRAEEPNLLAAIEWCLVNDPARVSEIVAPLSWHWYFRGLMGQALGWLRAALDSLAPGTPGRAAALAALAAQTRYAGWYAEARDIGLECAATYRALDDKRGLAIAMQSLTLTSLALGDEYAALQYAHEVEGLTADLGLGVVRGAALNCTGLALRQLGHPVAARQMFEEAHAVWSEINDEQGIVIANGNLAIMDFQTGALVSARSRTLLALRISRSIGYSVGVLDAFGVLATIDAAEGRHERAVRLLAVAESERAEIGAPLFIADELTALTAAWAVCRQALGPEVERIADHARRLPLDALVTEILTA
ncbi:BTAD domain-containing putative transcriptional regulator [Kribbella sp. NPDC051952]|uniref:ATP-binding protein n=1 Tax=Kribbella sp. NPDC051952 TaxID=3154851 RepID=UPI0034443E25